MSEISSALPATARPMPAVAIVSVTYNRCGPLLHLLSQLRGLDYPHDRFDIFLTDNASVDDTAERVAREFTEVRLDVRSENVGTSAGFNTGIRAALNADRTYDYIWLLDSDAEVEAGSLLPLVTALEQVPNIGIVGSSVYDPSARDHLVTSGLNVNWRNGTVALMRASDNDVDSLLDVDLIPACSLMIRSHLCRNAGLWDERFWIYWGDTDWCTRVKRSGFRVCGHAHSRVWHRDWANTKRGFAAPAVLYDDLRGGLLFNVRHHPHGALEGARRLLLKSYFKGACEYLTMRPQFGAAYVAAARDFMAADFSIRDYNQTTAPTPLASIAELCATVRELFPRSPRILLNQVSDDPVYDDFRSHATRLIPDIVWAEEGSDRREKRSDFTTDYARYVRHHMVRFIAHMVTRKYDVIVSEIGVPSLYTLVMARHTILLAADGSGVLRRNRLASSLFGFCARVLAGLRVAYFDLPRALKHNERLRRVIADFQLASKAP